MRLALVGRLALAVLWRLVGLALAVQVLRGLRLALVGLGRRLALAVLVMLGLAMMVLRGFRLALVVLLGLAVLRRSRT